MGQLDGKVALVTGAAVGIGRAIAVAYGREGARVVVNYSRSKKEAEETADLVGRAGASDPGRCGPGSAGPGHGRGDPGAVRPD